MNHYELYKKYKEEYHFRDGDCCATCKYGDVYHEEEMHCNRFEHIEVSHTDICDLFEKEEKMNENRPPNLQEANGCHNCKYSVNPYWMETMRCGLYNYEVIIPYEFCDSWEEDKK